jgi:hypothetical protein
MIKRNKTFLLHSLLILALMFAAVPASAEEDEFDNGDFEGSFGLFTEGTATIGQSNFVVVGRATADGNGNVSGTRTVKATGFDAFPEIFTCTYTVNPDGTGTAACEIEDFCDSTEEYAFVIVQEEEIHFMMTSVVYGNSQCFPAEPFVRAILRKQGKRQKGSNLLLIGSR